MTFVAKDPNGENVSDCRWVAYLSNGEEIHEDMTPEEEPAWVRLGKYLSENNLTILKLRLHMNGLVTRIPDNAEGYFQMKKAIGAFGQHTRSACGIGHLKDGQIRIIWCTPERISWKETREDPGLPCTIYNKPIIHKVSSERVCNA